MFKEEFEVLTAVLMRIQVFWNMTQCGLVNSYVRLGETYCLHLHGREVQRDIRQSTVRNTPVGLIYSDRAVDN